MTKRLVIPLNRSKTVSIFLCIDVGQDCPGKHMVSLNHNQRRLPSWSRLSPLLRAFLARWSLHYHTHCLIGSCLSIPHLIWNWTGSEMCSLNHLFVSGLLCSWSPVIIFEYNINCEQWLNASMIMILVLPPFSLPSPPDPTLIPSPIKIFMFKQNYGLPVTQSVWCTNSITTLIHG